MADQKIVSLDRVSITINYGGKKPVARPSNGTEKKHGAFTRPQDDPQPLGSLVIDVHDISTQVAGDNRIVSPDHDVDHSAINDPGFFGRAAIGRQLGGQNGWYRVFGDMWGADAPHDRTEASTEDANWALLYFLNHQEFFG